MILGIRLLRLLVLTLVKGMGLPGSQVVGSIVHIRDVFGALSDAQVQSVVHGGQAFVVKSICLLALFL